MKSAAFVLVAVSFLLTGCVGVSVSRSDSGGSGNSRAGNNQRAVQLRAVDVDFARLSSEKGRLPPSRSIPIHNPWGITPDGPNTTGAVAFQAELKDLARVP